MTSPSSRQTTRIVRLMTPLLACCLGLLALSIACGGDVSVRPSASPNSKVETPTPTIPALATPTPTPMLAPSPTEDVPTTFDDPFSYCAAVGIIDAPDNRWAGPTVPDTVRRFLLEKFNLDESLWSRSFFGWRCYQDEVWGCFVGANIPCGPANTSREPNPAMVEFCQENPESDDIAFAVTGHDTIYLWDCHGGTSVIDRQWLSVGPRGFISEYWHKILP